MPKPSVNHSRAMPSAHPTMSLARLVQVGGIPGAPGACSIIATGVSQTAADGGATAVARACHLPHLRCAALALKGWTEPDRAALWSGPKGSDGDWRPCVRSPEGKCMDAGMVPSPMQVTLASDPAEIILGDGANSGLVEPSARFRGGETGVGPDPSVREFAAVIGGVGKVAARRNRRVEGGGFDRIGTGELG